MPPPRSAPPSPRPLTRVYRPSRLAAALLAQVYELLRPDPRRLPPPADPGSTPRPADRAATAS